MDDHDSDTDIVGKLRDLIDEEWDGVEEFWRIESRYFLREMDDKIDNLNRWLIESKESSLIT